MTHLLKHRRVLCAFLSPLLFVLTGCSAFVSATQTVSVTSEPNTAEIYINGEMAGTGSASKTVKRNENVQIMARAVGHETVQRSIGTHLSGVAVLDIVGGVFFLIPFIGLATPGARTLDEANISIVLPRLQSAAQDATKVGQDQPH